jgi:hypothetical protein
MQSSKLATPSPSCSADGARDTGADTHNQGASASLEARFEASVCASGNEGPPAEKGTSQLVTVLQQTLPGPLGEVTSCVFPGFYLNSSAKQDSPSLHP